MTQPKITHFVLFTAMTLLCAYCTPSRIVQPLQKGERQVGAHLGGPLIKFAGAPIPIPFTSLSYAQGVTNKLTAFGGVGLTAAAFGVADIDVGATYGLLVPQGARPGVSVSTDWHFMLDKWAGVFSCYPTLDANAYWTIGKPRNTAYIGLNNWFELRNTRAHGELQTQHWLPNLQAGYIFRHGKWNYTLEAKYLAAGIDNVKLVPDYIGAGGYGAFGFYFNVARSF